MTIINIILIVLLYISLKTYVKDRLDKLEAHRMLVNQILSNRMNDIERRMGKVEKDVKRNK